jgi:putative ABC transport system permease protein
VSEALATKPAPLHGRSQFGRIFLWQVVRNVAQHRLLALLNVLSVGLGIAVYLAIQIANHSATRSFAAGIDLVAGKAQLEARGAIDETLWPALARQPGVRAATATVEDVVTLPDFPGEYLRVLGLDLFTGDAFRTFELRGTGERLALEDWLGRPGAMALGEEFARAAGLKLGSEVRVMANGAVHRVQIVALVPAADSPAAAQRNFAVMDLGWAQELFGTAGRLSSVLFLLDDPARSEPVAAELRKLVPADVTVGPPRQRSAQVQTMLAAFQLNLTALSMVSLLVGVFLIYNTIAASVARRRVEVGILRALGATRWEVRALFLGEAALFGVLGIACGIVGGVLLARVLTGAVEQTITSLYVLLSIDRSYLHPAQFLTAVVLGMGSVLLGAWLPANDAARVDPVGSLSLGAHQERSAARVPRWGKWGWMCLTLAVGSAAFALRSGPATLGFVAAFFVLAGASCLAPAATLAGGWLAARHGAGAPPPRVSTRGGGAPAPWGVLRRMAGENLRRSVQRNAITVAALAAAIAMMVGLVVMIFSFRGSVDAWIGRGIVADLFIAPAANEIVGLGAHVSPAAIAWLEARPEVTAVDTFREQTVTLATGESALLAVVKGAYRGNLTFVGGDDVRKMQRVFHEGGVAVTEPFARRFRMKAGDTVRLVTPRGLASFEIVGVYSDFTRDQGAVLIERGTFERYWDEPGVFSLAVYLRPGADSTATAEAFRREFGREGEFAIYSNRTLRQRILAIFDQTFAVTYVLRTVAIVVAVAGIFLSVTTLVAERAREIGMLRAIGASRGQIRALFMLESGLIGAVATALGLAAGVLLAMVLTWVVNPAFFGWTIALRLPWWPLLATPLWIVPATLLAAWYPAWQASRSPVAEALREE